jgi:hypothetical protein
MQEVGTNVNWLVIKTIMAVIKNLKKCNLS